MQFSGPPALLLPSKHYEVMFRVLYLLYGRRQA